ncbi:DUF4912 domain-containing protein [Exiguobacterium sp. TDN 0502]|uniref:DUF4912 domain-containing protein n=1 Tax=Exiguobacterium sp. TDN 0502 TaxID=3420731 RepID=UPI003D7808DA
MLEQIIKMKEQGLTTKQIAAQLDTTEGKVKYAWTKYRKSLAGQSSTAVPKVKPKTVKQTKKRGSADLDVVPAVHVMPSLERDAFGMATHYEDDILHAIVQSPTALYVYWELSELSKQLLETHYHTAFDSFRKELRIIDVTLVDYEQGQANRTYQFELPEMTNAWFVRPVTPNTTYIIEWGIQTIDGDFVPVLRSKPVETPRDEPVADGRFAEVVHHWQYGEVEQPEWVEVLRPYSYFDRVR